ncbi:MAG: sulfate/molybdate ABC transporter ATP-binding protein [Verrucomicrobiaceae bacterium]|nr:MAG: sulfate/molybdate ABC transporter ATP-binding protein [Verrucomicrobiaceae bacterium]
MSISIQNISRSFGSYTALNDINLEVESGELISLLGPSGSGKTTLLRIIAGLERSDTGRILLNEADATTIPVSQRRVGFVFQHYALFRHMTVFKNIAFGLSVRPRKDRPSSAAIREKVLGLLKLMQLEGLQDRYPNQLSGGQRQRVALARALATDPQVLLLDEPFGALDAKVRKELRKWLRQLHQELHITTVFVTHDQDEALEVADRVVVMNQARIEQVGTPQEIYDRPATPFVHEFLGDSNALRGEAGNEGVAVGSILLPKDEELKQREVVAYVRPHNVRVAKYKNGVASFEVKVRHVHSAGPVARLELQRTDTGEELEAEVSRQHFSELDLQVGDTAFASLQDARIYPHQAEI